MLLQDNCRQFIATTGKQDVNTTVSQAETESGVSDYRTLAATVTDDEEARIGTKCGARARRLATHEPRHEEGQRGARRSPGHQSEAQAKPAHREEGVASPGTTACSSMDNRSLYNTSDWIKESRAY